MLMDTQGPAIRTGDLPTKLDLKVGDEVKIEIENCGTLINRMVADA